MSIFSTNRFKSLSAEYVEESIKLAPDVSESDDIVKESAPDVSESEDISIDEAMYIDSLLEALD